MLGADGFRVELHAPREPPAIADRHDRAVVGPRDRLELGRQRGLDDERVVADRAEALRQAAEDALAAMEDGADAAMHDLRAAHDAAAAHVREALVAEAHAEHGHRVLQQRLAADAEVALALGAPGPGETTIRSHGSPASTLHASSSLRTTTGSSPTTLASSW